MNVTVDRSKSIPSLNEACVRLNLAVAPQLDVKNSAAAPMSYPCLPENHANQPIPCTCYCAKVAARSSIGAVRPVRRATFAGATFAASICAAWTSPISIFPTATFAKPICAGSTCAAADWKVRASMQHMYLVPTSRSSLHQKRSKCLCVSAPECARGNRTPRSLLLHFGRFESDITTQDFRDGMALCPGRGHHVVNATGCEFRFFVCSRLRPEYRF